MLLDNQFPFYWDTESSFITRLVECVWVGWFRLCFRVCYGWSRVLVRKIVRLKSWKFAKIDSWRAGNEEGLCKMGCAAADRKTTPELLWSLCHEAILRELRWLLLPNPRSRPGLASIHRYSPWQKIWVRKWTEWGHKGHDKVYGLRLKNIHWKWKDISKSFCM